MQVAPSLIKGTLIKRYKRFLADVQLDNGDTITAHCPNTGSMKNCLFEGHPVWLSVSDNPKRKYAHTWEWAQDDCGHRFSVNTARANALVVEAIEAGVIKELSGYSRIQTEVKYGQENSRIDIKLSSDNRGDCFVEVKSVTLHLGDGLGAFPDAVSTRGQKHLRELMHMVENGQRAVLVFAVVHTGIEQVCAAFHIDPAYSELLNQALKCGVEVLAYCAEFKHNSIYLTKALPIVSQNSVTTGSLKP
ncbi:DNA/RNA nuclease SfsA [Paraferrimonas sedimenticola]|uniref:Sugar fermentation stimulation protein homolog n=1 Tax=Paraferrimonas sedimenticola TaxID=375674 RepID=A0AA37RVH0_9GAMM|nr:DNA/RNA nuclease SfsA [Paraferrimonas sedimenticola]GLP95627.1 sugar fermentation stimulation protein [Paraferrimonas sedimenticola]